MPVKNIKRRTNDGLQGTIVGLTKEEKQALIKDGELITKAYGDKSYGRLSEANTWSGVNFFSNELHVNQQITDTTGMDFLYAGSDLSSTVVGDSFKRVTGFGCAYPFNDIYAVEGFALVAPDDTSRPTLTFLSMVGKIRWSDLSTGWTPTSYDYQLPKKSGTIALTSDLSEAGTSVTIRRW